jgi:putative redox protein
MQMDRDDGGVVVCTESALCTEVKANGHDLVADEPPALGGSDAGPTPYDYLLTALGSCTAITVRMYADRKGWPLETVTVRVEHGRIHAKDCEECETKSGRIDRIELELELEGPLDAEQRDRLREIADKCPVKRTLGSEMLIETRTATK